MSMRRLIPLLTAALIGGAARPSAAQAPDTRVADLARAGRLRVALFLPQYTPDSITGKVVRAGSVGKVMVELANRLATRIGVQVTVDGYPTPPSVVACLRARTCDVALMGPDETRKADLDLSQPVIEIDYTYLVPAGSSIRSADEVDRSGVRIAGVRNHASTLTLSRQLKRATMVTAETPAATLELLRSGQADVLISVREALQYYYAPRLPGARVLDQNFGFNPMAIALGKGQAARLGYINEFVDDAKASGFLQNVINELGRQATIRVAPAEKRR